MKNNFDKLLLNFKSVSTRAAKEYLFTGDKEIFFVNKKHFIKREKLNNYNPIKKYIIKRNDFRLKMYLNDFLVKKGTVLFYEGPDNNLLKIATAYNLLILLEDELEGKKRKKCILLIDKIEHLTINLFYRKANNIKIEELWDEIQIFFQNICPENWYFIRKDIHKYVFVYIE